MVCIIILSLALLYIDEKALQVSDGRKTDLNNYSGIFGYINYLVEKDRKYIIDTLINGKSFRFLKALYRHSGLAYLAFNSITLRTNLIRSQVFHVLSTAATIRRESQSMVTRRMRFSRIRKSERLQNSRNSLTRLNPT